MIEQSKFLKIARAVDGDDWYMQRLKMCAELENFELTRLLAVWTTNGVADSITLDEDMTVDTSGVTDNQIKNTMKTQHNRLYPDAEPEPEVEPEEEGGEGKESVEPDSDE